MAHNRKNTFIRMTGREVGLDFVPEGLSSSEVVCLVEEVSKKGYRWESLSQVLKEQDGLIPASQYIIDLHLTQEGSIDSEGKYASLELDNQNLAVRFIAPTILGLDHSLIIGRHDPYSIDGFKYHKKEAYDTDFGLQKFNPGNIENSKSSFRRLYGIIFEGLSRQQIHFRFEEGELYVQNPKPKDHSSWEGVAYPNYMIPNLEELSCEPQKLEEGSIVFHELQNAVVGTGYEPSKGRLTPLRSLYFKVTKLNK